MAKQINLALLNGFLILSFGLLAFFIIRLDIQDFYDGGGTADNFEFWYKSTMHKEKTINVVICSFTAAIYFTIAIIYNRIRATMTNKYMANMILSSLIYQGLSRLFEIYYSLSESDLHYFIYVLTKFYLPLDILSVVLLSIVAISGFLIPADSETEKFDKLNQIMVFMAVAGFIIGILITLFSLLPEGSVIKIIIAAMGILLFGFLLIFIIFTIFNIFKSWSKMPPFLAMGIQLILSMLAMILLIFSEIGGEIFDWGIEIRYLFKSMKNGSFLLIGLLYYFSIIKPTKKVSQ